MQWGGVPQYRVLSKPYWCMERLGAVKQQAITWTNIDQNHRSIAASHGDKDSSFMHNPEHHMDSVCADY